MQPRGLLFYKGRRFSLRQVILNCIFHLRSLPCLSIVYLGIGVIPNSLFPPFVAPRKSARFSRGFLFPKTSPKVHPGFCFCIEPIRYHNIVYIHILARYLQSKLRAFYKFLGFKSVFYQKNFTLQINSSLMYNILK